jgi:transcriptional regulator with XRE-family HTH domain/quercetin dioxygenase-like cupin family protein
MPRSRAQGVEAPARPAEDAANAVGVRLRAERERQRIGLRELARRVGVSASLISQVELGKATPSVGTLYSIVNELGMSLDELFFESGAGAESSDLATAAQVARAPAPRRRNGNQPAIDASHPPAPAGDPVVRHDDRKAIQLDSGVRWERLTPVTEHNIDFLYVVYDVGGASCPENSLMRHAGNEYGHVLKGRLAVTVGFDTHELGPGDSISFDSTVPHRLSNVGDQPAEGIWFVVGRGGDARVTSREPSGQ